jgi:NADH:ubiquinone oxidoreductase subunit 3 (subunit A)
MEIYYIIAICAAVVLALCLMVITAAILLIRKRRREQKERSVLPIPLVQYSSTNSIDVSNSVNDSNPIPNPSSNQYHSWIPQRQSQHYSSLLSSISSTDGIHIERKLGGGNFGDVYRGMHVDMFDTT